MGVDEVQFAAQPAQGPDGARDEREAEQGPALDRPNPAVDLDAPVFLVADRVAGDGPGEDADGMPAARQLNPLRQGLLLGAAGEGVEVADDQADAEGAGISRWSARGRS
jgi:hypothetical protein